MDIIFFHLIYPGGLPVSVLLGARVIALKGNPVQDDAWGADEGAHCGRKQELLTTVSSLSSLAVYSLTYL